MPDELSRLTEGPFVIVGRSPGCPYWEYVFTGDSRYPVQEIRDPGRKLKHFLFALKGEALNVLEILQKQPSVGLKYQQTEYRIIRAQELTIGSLPKEKEPWWHAKLER